MQNSLRALLLLAQLLLYNVYGLQYYVNKQLLSCTKRQCIGKELEPVFKEGLREDSDTSWMTPKSSIVPVKIDKTALHRPELVTFGFGTLIERSQSTGRWLREALNQASTMTLRLPKPGHFTVAFDKAYEQM